MKKLFIVRHAKSDWANFNLSDFERPLNSRGLRDAPEMANRLTEKNIKIDLLVSSSANRALTTAQFFAPEFNIDVLKVDELYHASVKTFYKVIGSIKDEFNSVAIFSHNPGITDFVNELTPTKIDNMPTCGIFAINVFSNSWLDFELVKKEFSFFDYPKLTQQ